MRCSADQELLRGKLQLLRLRSLLQMRITRVAKKELKAFVSHAVTSGNPLVCISMLNSFREILEIRLNVEINEKVCGVFLAVQRGGSPFSFRKMSYLFPFARYFLFAIFFFFRFFSLCICYPSSCFGG